MKKARKTVLLVLAAVMLLVVSCAAGEEAPAVKKMPGSKRARASD